MSASPLQASHEEMRLAAQRVKDVGRQIWLRHLDSKTEAELWQGVPALAEVEALWDIADQLDAAAVLHRRISRREREGAPMPAWLPGICAMVVRRLRGMRA